MAQNSASIFRLRLSFIGSQSSLASMAIVEVWLVGVTQHTSVRLPCCRPELVAGCILQGGSYELFVCRGSQLFVDPGGIVCFMNPRVDTALSVMYCSLFFGAI